MEFTSLQLDGLAGLDRVSRFVPDGWLGHSWLWTASPVGERLHRVAGAGSAWLTNSVPGSAREQLKCPLKLPLRLGI